MKSLKAQVWRQVCWILDFCSFYMYVHAAATELLPFYTYTGTQIHKLTHCLFKILHLCPTCFQSWDNIIHMHKNTIMLEIVLKNVCNGRENQYFLSRMFPQTNYLQTCTSTTPSLLHELLQWSPTMHPHPTVSPAQFKLHMEGRVTIFKSKAWPLLKIVFYCFPL